MKYAKWILLGLVIIGALFYFYYIRTHQNQIIPVSTPTSSPISSPQILVNPTKNPSALFAPIADFKNRITKKPFGIYITAQNSPVQPERFTGYHTGTDVEYQDITANVPVYAISDGQIVLARTTSGYGGVMILSFNFKGNDYLSLYGHIRPSSLPLVGQRVKKEEQIGLLGTGYSSETDGERRHLHFVIIPGTKIDLRGYVQNQSELSGWIDPLSLY